MNAKTTLIFGVLSLLLFACESEPQPPKSPSFGDDFQIQLSRTAAGLNMKCKTPYRGEASGYLEEQFFLLVEGEEYKPLGGESRTLISSNGGADSMFGTAETTLPWSEVFGQKKQVKVKVVLRYTLWEAEVGKSKKLLEGEKASSTLILDRELVKSLK